MNNMRSIVFFLFALAAWSCQARAQNPADSLNVLFIGNSITYFNNMPFMFRDIAGDKGKNVSVTMYAPGGTGFVHHYTDHNVYALFRDYEWDVVVLQPGSGESAAVTYPVDTTIFRGRILLDSIYYYSPCARVYLYQIPYGVPSQSTYSTYFSTQTQILNTVRTMADSLRVQMIPVGECFRAYYSTYQNLLLHGSYNDIHPNANGSFLAASAFYAGIFQDTVSGCSFYSTIVPDTAQNFFTIADSVVLPNLASWRINTYNLHSDFTYSVSANSVSFTSLAVNQTSFLWDFGDSNFSSSQNPVHVYNQPGFYTVKLYAYHNGCVDSSAHQLLILPLSGEGAVIDATQILVSPNPVLTKVTVRMAPAQETEYRLYNLTGKLIETGTMNNEAAELDLSELQQGVYLLCLYSKSSLIHTTRIVKSE